MAVKPRPAMPVRKPAPAAKKATPMGASKNAAMEDRRSFNTGFNKSMPLSPKPVMSSKDIGKTGNAKVATNARKTQARATVNAARGGQSMGTPSVSSGPWDRTIVGRNNPGGVASGPKSVIHEMSKTYGTNASAAIADRQAGTVAKAPTAAAKVASRRQALAKFGSGSQQVLSNKAKAVNTIKDIESGKRGGSEADNMKRVASLKSKWKLK